MNKLYLKNLLISISVILIASFSNKTFTMTKLELTESIALENKTNKNSQDELYRTPAFYAYLNGTQKSETEWDFSLAEKLIENGAYNYSIIILDKNGRTPAFCACMAGKIELAKKLQELSIEKEACITKGYFLYTQAEKNPLNLTDIYGQTPLFQPCINGELDIANTLIKNGANTNAVDKLGKKIIDYAKEKGHKNIVALLERNGATKTKTESLIKPEIDSIKEQRKNKKKLLELQKKALSLKNKQKKDKQQEKKIAQKSEWQESLKDDLKDLSDTQDEKTQETIDAKQNESILKQEITKQLEKECPRIQCYTKEGANPSSISINELIERMNNDQDKSLEQAMFDLTGSKDEQDSIANQAKKQNHRAELFDAYCKGNFNKADEILKSNESLKNEDIVNLADPVNQTPIFHLIMSNFEEIMQNTAQEEVNNSQIKNQVYELIKKGANVNHKNVLGQTPIFFAYARGLKTVVDLLKENGAQDWERDKVDYVGQNPLYLAYSFADFKTIKALKSWGFKGDINMKNNRKQSVLFFAFMSGKIVAANKLLNATKYGEKINAKGNINTENEFFMSPLFHAYINGNIEAAENLKNAKKYGFRENAKGCVLTKNSLGRSPLFIALACGYEIVTETLNKEIEKEYEKLAKENPNHKKPDYSTTGIYETDNKGWTPLHYACSLGYINAVKKILQTFLDKTSFLNYINKKDKDGNTALDIAIKTQLEGFADSENLNNTIVFLQNNGAKAFYYKDYNKHMENIYNLD